MINKNEIKFNKYEVLELKNKEFADKCISIFFSLNISNYDIEVLTDLNILNRRLGKISNYSFPILKEIDSSMPLVNYVNVKGYKKYYDKIYTHNNKKYIVCNDWYYNNKIGTKDNRTCFVKFIEELTLNNN